MTVLVVALLAVTCSGALFQVTTSYLGDCNGPLLTVAGQPPFSGIPCAPRSCLLSSIFAGNDAFTTACTNFTSVDEIVQAYTNPGTYVVISFLNGPDCEGLNVDDVVEFRVGVVPDGCVQDKTKSYTMSCSSTELREVTYPNPNCQGTGIPSLLSGPIGSCSDTNTFNGMFSRRTYCNPGSSGITTGSGSGSGSGAVSSSAPMALAPSSVASSVAATLSLLLVVLAVLS